MRRYVPLFEEVEFPPEFNDMEMHDPETIIGKRVRLIKMDDPHTKLRPGDMGTVRHVDSTGTIFVSWDNGEGLGLVEGEDEWELE